MTSHFSEVDGDLFRSVIKNLQEKYNCLHIYIFKLNGSGLRIIQQLTVLCVSKHLASVNKK